MKTTEKISQGQIEQVTGGVHYKNPGVIVDQLVVEGLRTKVLLPEQVSPTQKIDLNKPTDFDGLEMVDSNHKLVAVNEKDIFITEFRFSASSSVSDGRLAVELDIGGSLGVIRKNTINLHKTQNTTDDYAVTMLYYTGSTFIANGGTVYIRAISGNITFGSLEVIVTRIHKGQ